jgi:hypothetical protein
VADPAKSVVKSALFACLERMQRFSFDDGGPWALLRWLGGPTADQRALRIFARALLVRASCGIFRRLEVRLATALYHLQWLISDATSDEEKLAACRAAFAVPVHCRPIFLKHLLQLFPTVEGLRSPSGVAMVRTLESSLIFSTDEVERENAHIRRSCKSDGQGKHHNPVINKELCRKVREYHMLKGGSDPALGLAHPSVEMAAADSPPSFLAPPVQPQPLPAAEGAAAVEGGVVGPPGQPGPRPLRVYGNPKLCYINHKVSSLTEHRTKRQLFRERQEFAQQYDEFNDSQKQRWLTTFKAFGIRRAPTATLVRTKVQKRSDAKASRVRALVARNGFSPMWCGSLPSDLAARQCAAMPFSEQALQSCFQQLYSGKVSRLEKECGGASRFTIGDRVRDRCKVLDDADDDAATQARLIWGCGGGLHNVCSDLKSPEFHSVASSLSSWVDRLGKDERQKTEHLVCISGEDTGPGPARPLLVCLVFLGGVVLSPKVQTFVYCIPEDSDHEEFMLQGLPRFPCDVHLGTAESRLCTGYSAPTKTLAHVSSDELVLRLVGFEHRKWSAALVDQHMRDDLPSLMVMRVDGLGGDPFPLSMGPGGRGRPMARAAPLASAALRALGRLRLGDPEAEGQRAAGDEGRWSLPSTPSAPRQPKGRGQAAPGAARAVPLAIEQEMMEGSDEGELFESEEGLIEMVIDAAADGLDEAEARVLPPATEDIVAEPQAVSKDRETYLDILAWIKFEFALYPN